MDIQYPLWINIDLWKEYLKMRKKIKKPLTDYGEKLALETLETLQAQGEDPDEVIKQSIFMSYQGLFPASKAGSKQRNTDWEALARGEG